MTFTKNLRRLCAVFTAAACMTLGACGRSSPATTGTDPQTCVSNADTAALVQKFPDLGAEFNRAAALPLTGKPVTDVIANPKYGFGTCEVAAFKEEGVGGDLVGRILRVLAKDPNRQAYLHEMFHGVQKVNGSLQMVGSGRLSIEDAIEGNMLVEAAAVGYTFTVYKEMSKTVPNAYDDFTATGYSFGMRTWFDEAYHQALTANAALPDQQREAKALEAGGKAVVEELLDGKNPSWAFDYAKQSAYNNAVRYSVKDRDGEAYMALRAELFRKAGAISPQVNITPDDLVSSNASQNIIDHLARTGVHIQFRRQ